MGVMPRVKRQRKPKETIRVDSDQFSRGMTEQRFNHAKDAAYDPMRDGRPQYHNPYGELLGEPPIGRRAIDQRLQAGQRVDLTNTDTGQQ